MKKSKQFATATEFRLALTQHITDLTKKQKGDAFKIRRHIAFDRLLARLFLTAPSPWVLKGGYAMQLRTPSARVTKDIDLAIRDGKLLSNNPDEQNAALQEILAEKAETDLGDYFEFLISKPIKDIDAAPYGGARFAVEVRLDARGFDQFHLDVGIGEVWIEPLDELKAENWLEFAGINPQKYTALPKAQQFAEKLHAYTLPRAEGRTNTRTKDMLDMILLIHTQCLDTKKVIKALHATFKRRGTHKFNGAILPPPSIWTEPFKKMAKESDLPLDLDAAFLVLQTFMKKLK